MNRSTCMDCKKEISGKLYCQKCYLSNHNPSKKIDIRKKHKKWCIETNKFRGKNNPNYIHGKSIGKNFCIDCGKEIARYNALRCRQCSNINVFYIDGSSYETYPKEFSKKLKSNIRKRDNYTCQSCNMTEEEHLIVFGQILHIHHIDNNKKNNKKENLITVCKQCNIRAKYNRDYWKDFFKEKVMSY